MEQEPGDDYIRRQASYIRTNERRLAESGFGRRRRKAASAPPSSFNPLGWVGLGESQSAQTQAPLVLELDTHHLFYLLMRIEGLGIDIGSLDVLVDPSRPLSYIALPDSNDDSDVLSIASLRSTMSAVSRLSLGMGWWGTQEQPSADVELKYIYSSFTKLPALLVRAPGPKVITELAQDPPGNNAIPLDSFKNLQSLECLDIDPRALLGWDRLAESLRSLTIKRSGIDDPTSVFVDAVLDDQLRREGDASRSRSRRLGHYSPKGNGARTPAVPETVHEDEETEDGPPEPVSPLSSPPLPAQLSPLKWAFLRFMSLADNALTSIPSTLFTLLSSLTYLDLSSNLLVAIPPGLSALYNLTSLDLSDNMIDSVLGIYTKLGQVLTLNLSRNRLESLCGLERLVALERVDLRKNLLDESAEVGRLSVLPHIAEVWVDGNPFVEMEEHHRVRCFDYFCQEGKQIMLDGSLPGFYERRGLSAAHTEQSKPLRPPPPAPYSPPVVASSSVPIPATSYPSPLLAPSPSTSASHPSPALTSVTPRAKRKRNKRIVALDGGDSDYRSSEDGGRRSGSHSRQGSEVVGKAGNVHAQAHLQALALPATPTILPTPLSSEPELTPIDVRPPSPALASTFPPPTAPTSSPVASTSTSTPKRPAVSRHSRYHTEAAPSMSRSSTTNDISDSSTSPTPLSSSNTISAATATTNGTLPKSSKRRNRVSASVYEPSSPSLDKSLPASNGGTNGAGNGTDAAAQLRDASAFRAKIEALRAEMGDNWLQVLSQSQFVQGVGAEGKRG